MTTTTYPTTPPNNSLRAPMPAQHTVSLARTTSSEWIKFSTLRSSWTMLLAAVIGLVAIGLAIAYTTGRNWVGLQPEDAVLSATMQGYLLAELVLGILGVLFVSGEYSTGMIRSTLAAVPKRVPVLLAKAGVLSAVVLVVMTVATFVTYLSSQALLGYYGHGFSLSDPTGLRVVLGTAVYLTLIALLGSALGWIVRSTPGGISALVALVMLVPGLLGLFGNVGKTLTTFLPTAGESFAMTLRAPDTLAPWSGLAVLVVWVVAAMVAAAVLLRRRDA